MEATCSSETSVDFQQRYIPGDRTLHEMSVQETGLEAVNWIPLALGRAQLQDRVKTVMAVLV
jgi:hypothetical protein